MSETISQQTASTANKRKGPTSGPFRLSGVWRFDEDPSVRPIGRFAGFFIEQDQ
jgi:hypothetical protein